MCEIPFTYLKEKRERERALFKITTTAIKNFFFVINESVKHFSKYYTIPGGKTVWEGIVLTTGSKGLGWYMASTGLIVLWGKEAQYSYFYCNYPSGVDPLKCMKCPHFWQQSLGSSNTDMLVKFQGGNKTTLLYSRLRVPYKKISQKA